MANHESNCYLCNLPLEMGEHCQCDKYSEIHTHKQSSQFCSNELQVQVLPPNTITNLEVAEPIHCTSVEHATEPCKENFGEPTRRPYKCNECSASFSRYTLLTAHKRKHSEGPPFICDDCSQNFENENDWLDHKEIGCIVTDAKYRQSQRKQQHSYSNTTLKKLHNRAPKENRFKCHHCSKSFKSVWIRNDHERNLHEGLRPHSCDECGKQFYRKFNLTVHKRKHSTDRPHECKICHKRFKASIGVKVHMEIHSDRRPFMCENCGKVFKTLFILESHRTIHTGETKFSCTVCGKSYRYRASLFIHMRTHTGQRPYNCNHCNASFMVKSHLTEHLRIHTGERPFECEFCSACFSRSISLKKHLKSHIRAGFDVNIDKAMYHAKIQAHITPRANFPAANDKLQLIPKVTHFMKDNIFIVTKECDSFKPFTESMVLYTDPPTDEMALLVVTVTSIGDGSMCIHEFTKLPMQSNKLTQNLTKNTNLVEINGNNQDQQILLLKDLQNNEMLNFPDLSQVGNIQEDVDKIPVLSLPDGTCSENVTGESVGLNNLSNYECCTEKASLDSRLCRDWMVSQNDIDDTILRSDHIGIIGSTSVGQHNDLQIYSMNSGRQESIVNFTSRIDVECNNAVYHEKITNTNLNHISVKNEEEILMDNKIKSILLNQDISIVSDVTRTDTEEQSKTCQLVAQLYESETVDTLYGNATIKCYKNKRKPLRKCRYCDVSYRYAALLEAHEAKHERQTKESVIPDSENSVGEYYLYMSTTLGEDLPFRCEKCHSSFSFRSELRNHVKLHSSKYHYTCKKCHQAFQQEIFLAKHQCGRSFPNSSAISHNSPSTLMIPEKSNKSSEVELKYKCDHCGKEFHKEFALKVHYRKHTGKRPFKCDDCKMRFISAQHCRVHRRIHRGEQAFVCKTCSKSFRYRINFHNHMKMCQAIIETEPCKNNPSEIIKNIKLSHFKVGETVTGNTENLVSPLCKLQGDLKEDYAVKSEPQEVVESLKEKIVDHIDQFEIVNKDEISLYEIKENSSVYHLLGKDVLENLQTNKAIPKELQVGQSSEAIGDIHIEAPSDFPTRKKIEGLLRCEHCPKLFKFKSILHIHTRSHTGAKPFSCSVCGKSFSKKSNMVIHMRIHTGERPFLCDYCGKCFTYKYTLSAHKRLHTQERPFICGVCGKSFRYEASRHVHLKRHANDRAFKCDLCQKAFVAKVDMEDHRRTHTGEKPYKCEHCDRKFTVRHHLTEHRRLHTGEKPYKCQYCTMTFARAATLKIHLQKHLKIVGNFL